ncbi:DUF4124 domain-containing protein [Thiobacillus sedimenti]|uniref:DUF4124 domain-containing protein n=1 Tax=Thiobacillus sedimenti TaxID=3110231 RepID=A0ABZ1CIA1_9PROT|nr:DUF4124 domain-containing protein [Thiobacillus sp. SCUT-2]WRS38977.1 DUF4124 domain-containing protein [Thiobacillus sp. SCUT-2]
MPTARLFLLFGLLLSASAQAEIYKYVDENGQVTFTDVYRKGARRVDLPGAPGPVPGKGNAAKRASYAPSPAGFPRIDPATQKRRDDVRRQVLQDEIASEQRDADEARRQLKLGERLQPGERATDASYANRVNKLRATLQQHEQNIADIRRELANLK